MKINITRQTATDGAVAALPLVLIFGWLTMQSLDQPMTAAVSVIAGLLYLRPVWWAVTYVRKSGLLLTGDTVIGSLLACLAAPLLLPVVVVRDCARSRWLAGLCLIFLQIAGLLLWLSPTRAVVVMLPLLAWLSGGLLRLYSQLAKPGETRPLKLARAVVGWPVLLCGFVVKYAWLALLNILHAWPLLLLGGLIAEPALGNWAIGVLIVAGLVSLPLLFGVTCGALWPAGFDGLQPGSFSTGGTSDFTPSFSGGHLGDFGLDQPIFNPANGLPMVGGIGGFDVHGNSYGSNMHDHF